MKSSHLHHKENPGCENYFIPWGQTSSLKKSSTNTINSNSVAQKHMRARAYCALPSIRDHWTLRCMSRCPDQVVSLKLDPKSPSKLGTNLSPHCSRDGRLSRLCPAQE
ncbi:uncharacterized protein TNCV_3580621 [Trichonephila clavipes]|nr:uncharacterized protein TNCV_3580621 [Trichonephila clavipes]